MVMKWLHDLFTAGEDEHDDAREEAYRKLESGQVSLTEIQVKVEKIGEDAKLLRAANRANHYRDRIAAYYRGAS